MAPPPELSWRTRREIKLTRTLGFPTFSSAFFVSSAFKGFFQGFPRYVDRAGQGNGKGGESNIKMVKSLAP